MRTRRRRRRETPSRRRAASLCAQLFGDLEWAGRALDAALELGAPSVISTARFSMHRACVSAGRWVEARAEARAALELARAFGQPERVVMLLASVGYVEVELGSAPEGRAYIQEALELSSRVGFTFGWTNCAYLLGVAYAVEGSWESAREMLNAARQRNLSQEATWNVHQTELWLGAVDVASGHVGRGEAMLARAVAFFEGIEDEDMGPTVEVLRRVPELMRAGWIEPDAERVEQLKPPERVCAEGHLFASLRARALSAARQVPGAHRVTLRCGPECRWFELDGGDRVELGRSRKVRQVLGVLLDAHERDPGAPLSAAELFARGWPGESPQERAGLMRLYVIVNKLRRFGLEDVLETVGDGYRLSPEVELVRE